MTLSREGSAISLVKQAKSPREAMLQLATALDELSARVERLESSAGDWDAWGEEPEPAPEWDDHDTHVALARSFADLAQEAAEFSSQVQGSEGTMFDLPQPSPEKMERRRLLERQQLKLDGALAGQAGVPDDVDWTEAYAAGGPLWLYHGNRELVMQYPEEVRRLMVEDLIEDDPRIAHEVAIDILKQPAGEPDLEGGAGALAVGWISGKNR